MRAVIRQLWWIPIVAGCAADGDGDGLADLHERDLGTDPRRADSDGDGLDDLAEVEFVGTDPLRPDTDGDAASDGEEHRLCLDPMDPDSHPYTLGWPMVPCGVKEALMVGIVPELATAGKRVRRVELYDQENEVFDLYDLAGRPSVLVIFAGVFQGNYEKDKVEQWLNADNDAELNSGSMPDLWVRDAARSAHINLAFVALTEELGAPASAESMSEFCLVAEFGCFADTSSSLQYHVNPPVNGLPSAANPWLLLDERMIVQSVLSPVQRVTGGTDTDDTFHQKLAIMLDITPP